MVCVDRHWDCHWYSIAWLDRLEGHRRLDQLAEQNGAGRHPSLWQFIFEFTVLFFVRGRLTSNGSKIHQDFAQLSQEVHLSLLEIDDEEN